MKNILQLSTASDLTAAGNYFLAVSSPSIAVDPATGLNRAAIVKGFEIYVESTTVIVNAVLYLLDSNGNPINGFVNAAQKNIVPVEIRIPANNESYVNLQNMQVVANLNGLTSGIDYLTPAACESLTSLAQLPQTVSRLPEFEAYRLIAKSGDINLFTLMANAIVQSTKI
jgi:hypothetical protein